MTRAQVSSPVHQLQYTETASIKRVSSSGNMVPYFKSSRAGGDTPKIVEQQHHRTIVERKEATPGIRVISTVSGSVSSVKEGSPYGKTIRIPLDPSRMPQNK